MFSNKKMIIISKSKRKFLRQFFLLKLLDFAYSISFVIMHHDSYLHSWIPCIINMGTENRSTLVGVPEVKLDKKLRILTVSIVVAPDRSLEWAQNNLWHESTECSHSILASHQRCQNSDSPLISSKFNIQGLTVPNVWLLEQNNLIYLWFHLLEEKKETRLCSNNPGR